MDERAFSAKTRRDGKRQRNALPGAKLPTDDIDAHSACAGV